MKQYLFVLLFISAASVPTAALGDEPAETLSKDELAGFRCRILATTNQHLDQVIKPDGKVVELKGKTGDGMTALAFQLMHEMTGDPRYGAAALELADRIVADMRATKHGVLFIKEKDKDGETIDGGGPPAFGWYASAAGYILHKNGGRKDDLRYLATVADNFPWNAEGWWANTIDIETGLPKAPLSKPGAINKNAGMALAAGMLAECVQEIDPPLSARLRAKADKCVYGQIIPNQEPDGFWHYGLKVTDPKNKDILGYFMVTTEALIGLRHFAPAQRQPALDTALGKAFAFARKEIAPMTDPNKGPASHRRTSSTPEHFTLSTDPKQGFELGMILIAGGQQREGMKIIDHWLKNFPIGDTGQDGAKAVDCFAHMLVQLPRVRIALAGDSTVTDTAGWGYGFKQRLRPDVRCENFAGGGQSSRAFAIRASGSKRSRRNRTMC